MHLHPKPPLCIGVALLSAHSFCCSHYILSALTLLTLPESPCAMCSCRFQHYKSVFGKITRMQYPLQMQ